MKMRYRWLAVGLGCVVVAAAIAWGVVGPPASSPVSDQDHPLATSGPTGLADKPMIMWFHGGTSASVESLEVALSSGLITHVVLLDLHRVDADWKKQPQILRAIEVVKQSGAKLVWARDLWPLYKNQNISLADFFDPEYYASEIIHLMEEARQIKADAVALDLEPYAESPMKYYMKGKYQCTGDEQDRLRGAVRTATERVGKVDFVFPAGSLRREHPYNVLAELGELRISENTYYNNERTIKNIRYPYEIFGAFLSTSREFPGHPNEPLFLVEDIFAARHLWAEKRGLFLYTYKESLPVAQTLVAYAASVGGTTTRKAQASTVSRPADRSGLGP